MNQPTRRQNSSCDPCRRSKRRCALPDGTLGVPGKTICINCANLGHRCTFKFVQRTRQHKESRASRSSISLLELEDAVTSQSDNRDEEQMQLAVSESHNDTLTDFGDLSVWSNVSPGAFTDFDVFLNDLDGDWSNFAGLSDVGSSEDYHIPQDFPANCPEELTFSPPQNGPRLGLSRSSPLHLLNSRFEVDMMNKGLESIYDAVMTGAAARYLGYWCNSFADMHRYEFDGGDLNFQDPNRPCALDQSKALPLYQYTSATSTDNVIVDVPEYQYPTPADSSLDVASPNKDVAQQVTKVTLIGICKFLDNFGRLYGNELDKRARKEDEHTFAAVVQAFALQWLPNDSRKARSSKSDELPTLGSAHEKGRACHNTNLFEAAWYNAYSRLLGTRMNPSFVHCYSVFLFDMTAKPWNLSKRWPSVENTVAILDTALHQLKDLYGLVKSYCELLAATSVYRSLLHSSVNIIRWFGCVRDTIASFQHQRSCVFRELLLRSSGKSVLFSVKTCQLTKQGAKDTSTPLLAQQEVHSNISVNIPEMCQKAVRHLFGLFGCVNELKQILRSSLALPDELGLGNLFSQTIALVTDFNYNFSHQVGHHIQNLSQLDEKSQISVGRIFTHIVSRSF